MGTRETQPSSLTIEKVTPMQNSTLIIVRNTGAPVDILSFSVDSYPGILGGSPSVETNKTRPLSLDYGLKQGRHMLVVTLAEKKRADKREKVTLSFEVANHLKPGSAGGRRSEPVWPSLES